MAGCLLIRAHFILFRTRDIRREQTAPSRLFLLVAILSQALFALVSGHLMAFSFLSAGHLDAVLELINIVDLKE